MALYLINSTRSPVEFKRETNPSLSYPALPGSVLLSYSTDTVQMMVKKLVSELFSIRYNVFRFFKNQAVESDCQKAGLHSRVMLEGDLHYFVEPIGNMHQEEGSVSLIWSEATNCRALFEAKKEYKALDIYISPELTQQLSHFFPELGSMLQRPGAHLLTPHPCFISPALKDIVTAILECPYDETTSNFYFDLKVREYLYVLLEKHFKPAKDKYNFTSYEAEHIALARELLLTDLAKPPLTIRELSRQASINEFKLKTGFKYFYGTGIFECFQQARMEKARQLLLQTNKPIKEICALTGYPRMTNFITAFRKYFGYTPGSLRRNP